MTWQDKAFLAVYFLVVIILQCWWQSRLFKANKPISHFWQAVYYALAIAPMAYIFLPVWWKVAIIAVAERLAFFDIILSIFRKKPLLYNSDKSAKSVIDQWENRLSVAWVRIFKIFYVALFVTVLILL